MSIHLALPKGRMQEQLFGLLADAGVQVSGGGRDYRPRVSLEGFETKILKPQNIVEMLHSGTRDVGFAGADWVGEKGADLVRVLDTELNPVQVVAAAPEQILVDGKLPERHLVIASEYERLTRAWIAEQGLDAQFTRAYGATEVFPPEDADCIVDNTATGATLKANRLRIVHVLMESSTGMYANPRAMDDPEKRAGIEHLAMLLQSVLTARARVMLEVNVSEAQLDALVAILPCMRKPTVARLHSDAGYAVKAAILRTDAPTLIPEIQAAGGTDIVLTRLAQIIP